MQEQVEVGDEGISFTSRPLSGSNIRPTGNDIQRGVTILNQGCRLRAQDIGLAASIGRQTLPVFAPIRVGMFFTGDELVEPGEALAAGKIYDSNRYTLHGLLETMGCEIVDLGLVGDTLAATKKAMLRAASQADLVVTSGGVSVGEEDHVRIALEQLGDLRLWRLGIKPGKPLAYGQINDTAFLGLPGNPVSVFATFCLFVCPVIQIMQGRDWCRPIALPVPADFDWPKPDSRREFLRARLATDADNQTLVQIYPNQDSGVLTSTVWADGFVEIAENQTVRAGETVNYLPFAQFFS
jgi:molybdopterin molybdotransferase